MYIIIAGVGVIGKQVTQVLVENKHDVVVIDRDSEVCEAVYTETGALTIQGNATEIHILQKAGATKADAIVCLMHQAADNTNWPEGISYDPENDGVALQSLGVHEHWNNEEDKQYSRNMGTGDGIELITIMPGISGDVNGDNLVNSTDALIVLSCDVGIDVSQFCPMNCGDVNADGLINSTDALIILSYDVGMSVPFPVGEIGCTSSATQCAGCNP